MKENLKMIVISNPNLKVVASGVLFIKQTKDGEESEASQKLPVIGDLRVCEPGSSTSLDATS